MSNPTYRRSGPSSAAIESAAWREVMRFFFNDEVEAAYQEAQALGLGLAGSASVTLRMIESEWLSRREANRTRIDEFAEIELDARFDPVVADYLAMAWIEAQESVLARLDLDERPPALLTILVPEVDAPWTPGRHGFCELKRDYYKICLPAYLLQDEPELDEALRHEIAHSIIGLVSDGKIPLWLNEGIAMRMGGQVDETYREAIRCRARNWADARQLDRWFLGDREDEHHGAVVRDAYQQSRALVDFLVENRDEAALGRLAEGMSNNGFFKELAMQVSGQTHADEALKEVFGMSEDQLFADALAWVSRPSA